MIYPVSAILLALILGTALSGVGFLFFEIGKFVVLYFGIKLLSQATGGKP